MVRRAQTVDLPVLNLTRRLRLGPKGPKVLSSFADGYIFRTFSDGALNYVW